MADLGQEVQPRPADVHFLLLPFFWASCPAPGLWGSTAGAALRSKLTINRVRVMEPLPRRSLRGGLVILAFLVSPLLTVKVESSTTLPHVTSEMSCLSEVQSLVASALFRCCTVSCCVEDIGYWPIEHNSERQQPYLCSQPSS